MCGANNSEAADYIEFVVKVAIVEIYNERATRKHLRLSHPCVFSGTAGIRDLLDPKKDNLKIHEDKAKFMTKPFCYPQSKYINIKKS